MSAPIPPLDEAGINNFTDARNLILAELVVRMTEKAKELTADELTKYSNALTNIAKVQIASHKADTYEKRASAAPADPRHGKPTRREDDHEAPYGRKKDGTPYTPTEFRESLQEAVNDIYGITLDDALIHPERHPEGLYAEPTTKSYDSARLSSPSNQHPLDPACRLASENKTAPGLACRFAERDHSRLDPAQPTLDQIATRDSKAENSAFRNPNSASPRNHPVPPPAFIRRDALPRESDRKAIEATRNKSPPIK